MPGFTIDRVVADNDTVKRYPSRLTCFSLNRDGSYEEAAVARGMAFIPESMVYKIFDPEIADHIRKWYGGVIGVMHDDHDNVCPPAVPTRMFVLG